MLLKYAYRYASDQVGIFLNYMTKFYFNNRIGLNLHPLTAHIMPCYTHKMAIVSWP